MRSADSAPAPPPWLPMEAEVAGREDLIGELSAILERPGTRLSLVGAPGAGATTVAGAVAARLNGRMPLVAARLAGCVDAAEATLCLGIALGETFPADLAAIGEGLSALGDCLLLLDDADLADTQLMVDRLLPWAPRLRVLAVGRQAALRGPSRSLEPLPAGLLEACFPDVDLKGCNGRPGPALLRRMARAAGGSEASFLLSLPEDVAFCALSEAGIPGSPPEPVPSWLFLDVGVGVMALRRFVAEALRAVRPLPKAALAAFLAERCQAWIRAAEGGPHFSAPVPHQQPLLRLVARHHPDPAVSTLARVAWARGWIAAGQAANARGSANGYADFERPALDARSQALLAWAEGDALLTDGEIKEAKVAWEIAATQLRRARDMRLLALLNRCCGERLQSRGELDAALEALAEARVLSERFGGPADQAMALQSLARLFIMRTHVGLAEELLEEASRRWAGLGTPGEPPASYRFIEAELELVRGSLEAAQARLEALEAREENRAELGPALARRLADVAVRRQAFDEATRWAREARRRQGQLGHRGEAARSLRLLGDLGAVAGRPGRASLDYERAIREHIRCGDLRGLMRTLDHRILLEAEHGDARLAGEWRRLHDELACFLGLGEASGANQPPRQG